jgi:hypothetical protein
LKAAEVISLFLQLQSGVFATRPCLLLFSVILLRSCRPPAFLIHYSGCMCFTSSTLYTVVPSYRVRIS